MLRAMTAVFMGVIVLNAHGVDQLKMAPEFRASSDHYREPKHVAVQSVAFANPAVVLNAPANVMRGGNPPQIGIVRALPQEYDSDLARASANTLQATRTVVAFRSLGASRVRLHLSNVHLNGDLTVYGGDGLTNDFGSELLGTDGDIWTPSVEGDTIALSFTSADHFKVSELGHVFSATPASTSCFTDVSCNNFADRETLSKSIASMVFVSGTNMFACTGSLINATVTDRLFLTANHCISTQAEASSLELMWDFRSSSCGASTSLPTMTTHGATLLTTSAATDVTLLRLGSLPPNRVLLGWDPNRPAPGTTLYRISHPALPTNDGVYRQLYSTTIVSETVAACTTLGRPAFLYSTRSVGGTGGGSSGSPAITEGGYVVGQLLGACGPDPSDSCAALTKTVDGWFGQSYALLQPYIRPATATCTASSSNLCLLNNRFRVTLTVNDPRVVGTGYANATAQGDWGYFDVPAATSSTDKPVIFVKVIDGRPVNNRFWVFYGGLTDIQYTFVVTDIQTGATKTYVKATGTYDGAADTSAFAGN